MEKGFTAKVIRLLLKNGLLKTSKACKSFTACDFLSEKIVILAAHSI